MNAQPGVSLRDIKIMFGTVKVLEGLDLEIKPSEFLVLLGPSGCGKSTLLNAVAGLVDVRAGQIWIGGYWNWTGRHHAWVPGHWEAPRRGHHWAPHRWYRDGNHWRQEKGRWERDERRRPQHGSRDDDRRGWR